MSVQVIMTWALLVFVKASGCTETRQLFPIYGSQTDLETKNAEVEGSVAEVQDIHTAPYHVTAQDDGDSTRFMTWTDGGTDPNWWGVITDLSIIGQGGIHNGLFVPGSTTHFDPQDNSLGPAVAMTACSGVGEQSDEFPDCCFFENGVDVEIESTPWQGWIRLTAGGECGNGQTFHFSMDVRLPD